MQGNYMGHFPAAAISPVLGGKLVVIREHLSSMGTAYRTTCKPFSPISPPAASLIVNGLQFAPHQMLEVVAHSFPTQVGLLAQMFLREYDFTVLVFYCSRFIGRTVQDPFWRIILCVRWLGKGLRNHILKFKWTIWIHCRQGIKTTKT